jgi:hypothetical protein
MATARIRGNWMLSLNTYQGKSRLISRSLGRAELNVSTATRAGISGQLRIGKRTIPVNGRVKPGSPAIITLSETASSGRSPEVGLEAILYIPPWWPNIDYSYDLILGTMVVGGRSALVKKRIRRRIIAVTGIQPFK